MVTDTTAKTTTITDITISHKYRIDKHEHLWTTRAFKKSCRGVAFTPDGASMRLARFFLRNNM